MSRVRVVLLTMAAVALTGCATSASNSPGAAAAVAPAPIAPAIPPAPPALARFTAEAFFDTTSFALPSRAGLAFADDGKSLLISSDRSGVFNAYLLPIAGGAPVAVTNSADNATFAETAFPNDARLLISSDQGGNELDHVYVRQPDGTVHDLTPGDKVKASFLAWNRDKTRFYLTTNERDPKTFDVYEYAADTLRRRLLFRNSGMDVGAISGDGRHIALIKSRTSADADIYLATVGSASKPRLITPHKGNVSHNVYGFSPDGRSLIYSTDEVGEWQQAWAYDLAAGSRSPLVTADWDVANVAFSPSGKYRVVALNADASNRVSITDAAGNAVNLRGIPSGGNIGSVRFNDDESMVAFTVNADTSPSDIYVADLATGEARRLTKALSPQIDQNRLVEATIARFKSYDGLEIPGVLYRPQEASAANPVPALVFVHGGPGDQSTRGYSAMIQHLVNHGYAVYAINNRGSSGYGKTFFHLDDKRHGDVDLKDVVASKAFLQSMDWVADDQIGIMGGSYGGYMVAAALAFEPQAFDVGVNVFGVTNWVRTLKSIPPWWESFREALYDEMGDPSVDSERHHRISPLFHAKNIVKPMLVVQGANDPRVLQVESDELVAAVKANGVPVEYLLFPDEGHGFLRKQNRIAASNAYVRFLDRYLKKQPN